MPEAEGQVPAATAPAETVTAPTTEAAATTAPVTEADIFDDPKIDQFPRDYVEKLRKEAADSRVKAKESELYKQAFDGWDEPSQNVLLNVVNLLKTDTPKGVAALKEIVSALSPEEAAAVTDAIETATGETTEPELSVQEQIDKALADREQNQQQQAAVQAVVKQAEDLGYPPGTEDHIALLWLANYKTDGDLGEAAKLLDARNQKIIDDYIAKKTATGEKFIQPTDGTNPGPQDGQKPKTWADSRARLEARVEAMSRGGDS